MAEILTQGRFFAPHGCPHINIRTDILPVGSTHFAKKVCSDCGRFLDWIPKPGTMERRRTNMDHLTQLALISDKLSEWEREFVRSLSQQKKTSPKQQRILDEMSAKYLENPTV